jgi:hypothetical protein
MFAVNHKNKDARKTEEQESLGIDQENESCKEKTKRRKTRP